ncbi:MAG: serine hydrolase [Alphaproteobacteria bacterium]|nr:serine hydrolase [Alphaproteobacteria bacterium]
MDRRTFLLASCGTAGALALPWAAGAADGPLHVLYPGSTTQAEAEELRDTVAGILGPAVAAHLRVVHRGDAYAVIFDRSHLDHGDDAGRAAEVAAHHERLLAAALDADGPLALVVGGGEVASTWNVRYGETVPSEQREALRQRFDAVARMLGSGVAKSLAVEELAEGSRLQLIYRRQGDRAGTVRVAAHHAGLLARQGISAEAVPEGYAVIAFDGRSADAPGATPAPADTGHLLPASVDSDLREAINGYIQDLRGRGRIASVERTSWVVHDLSADRTLAAINASVPMQAASMIKPFVALAFFHRVERGELAYGPVSRDHLEKSLRDSSNTSTNWLLERVGGPRACQRILEKHFGQIAEQVAVVEYIPSGGRTYLNLASANDHARLLRALWLDELPGAGEIRRAMNLPSGNRLYTNVPEIPVGTEVYNKTGTTARCCGDMGILVARTRRGERIPYIVVGVIERDDRVRSSYGSWMHSRGDVIRGVSGLTYRYLKTQYDLA